MIHTSFSQYLHLTVLTEVILTLNQGDPGGITLVTDVSHSNWLDKSGHLFLRKLRRDSLGNDELTYLHQKGVFSLPHKSVSDVLIRIYFHHVHPFFPILNAKTFLAAYEDGAYDRIGIHLLWSVFLAASLFVKEETLRDAGFASRKDMKRAMYQKAKALYDMQYEKSKTTLIQAVLLMGFWYSDTQDRTGPLHWIGVAISLCQSAGLHRKSSLGTNQHNTDTEILWRQLWWACVYRDAWYAVGQGKPMRIAIADCNTEMPSVKDCEHMYDGVEETLRAKYLPDHMDLLSQLWVDLLKLTVVLIQITITMQRDGNPGDSRALEQKEEEILACRQNCIALMNNTDRLAQIHVHHVELYCNSTLLVLYRPHILQANAKRSREIATPFDSFIEQRAQTAAARINGILAQLIASDAVDVCQGIICMALIPPMQIHMLNHLSKDPLVRQLHHHQLEICMVVMKELKKTYFGAEIIYKIFENAKAQIQSQALTLETHAGDTQSLAQGSGHIQGVMPGPSNTSNDHADQPDDVSAVLQSLMRQHDYFDIEELDFLNFPATSEIE
ncbi:hypothetical protein PFICI_12413 [Pestalotiopsis fici W106-1]|uniref:Xylanolytic transcriptional activator regulatory domain-containing protein n=1 Tax=Pestalotiopsis fici (strain W106-1 / CGMCC3.15140) TaxID=1229662 RepID=W3WNU8_PESFW|nr:uncharacterized protein PFICI_12413 [Pestalotiopsis fici W106-1]ETS75469.1 hypothetical protein PFICI_12413 [Pestalotiopsis fici W106-1]